MDEMDGLLELRSMLQAKEGKKEEKRIQHTEDNFLSSCLLPAKQTIYNWIFGIIIILTAIALEAGRRSPLRA